MSFLRRLSHVGALMRDVWAYARLYREWWLVPVVVVLLLVAVLVVAGTKAMVLVYTIF